MDPLTSEDCDLRAFPTMPLDAVRLFGSEFHAVANDGAWRAGVTLWLRAWHQVPAASLPDDDIQLTRLAELGRDVKTWKKLRSQALHGWIKCSDGRLYHPVVAELANSAMAKRKAFKERSAKANEKRWGEQKDDKGDPKAILQGDAQGLLGDPKERESKGKGEERDSSVAKATGAEAPKLDLGDKPKPDADKVFWDNAKAYLAANGVSNPGAMIGKWIREQTKPETANALSQAQLERAVDPIPFVQGYFRKRRPMNGDDGELEMPFA